MNEGSEKQACIARSILPFNPLAACCCCSLTLFARAMQTALKMANYAMADNDAVKLN